MAEEDDKEKNDKVETNPDIASEVEGMVDLSDVLATGDNETGAASAEDALQEHAEQEEQEAGEEHGAQTNDPGRERILASGPSLE